MGCRGRAVTVVFRASARTSGLPDTDELTDMGQQFRDQGSQ